MNEAAYQKCLDGYGAAIGEWPAELRREAEALLERSAAARAMLAEAKALDLLLNEHFAEPEADPFAERALRDKLLSIPDRYPQRPSLPSRLATWLAPRPLAWSGGLGAAFASACMGFVIGQGLPSPTADLDLNGLIFGAPVGLEMMIQLERLP